MANGMLAPAGVMLNGFNTYMNGLKLANTSKVATIAIEVGQTAVNIAASSVGIDNYYNQNRLFWSGWGDGGVTAEKFARENGMTTLEMTLVNPPSFLDNPKYWNGNNGVSANFAKTAQGDVTALLIPNFSFNYPGINTFKDLEFGLLLNNSDFTSINLIW